MLNLFFFLITSSLKTGDSFYPNILPKGLYQRIKTYIYISTLSFKWLWNNLSFFRAYLAESYLVKVKY